MNNCCCIKTYNYCEQDVCGSIDLGIAAAMPGVYKITTFFLGTKIVLQQEFIQDENISFDIDMLNENYEYTFELRDPNGDKVTINRDDILYDCFKFKTVTTVTNAVGSLSS